MVLDANKQFHLANKHIVDFMTARGVDASIIEAWKTGGAAGKLKAAMMRESANPPKKVVSKYLYFCQDERSKILAANPGMNIKDCTCELGRRWKDFQETFQSTDEGKARMQRYQAAFDADRIRYDEEKALKGQIHHNAPVVAVERKPTAYLVFCAEQRKTNPKISLKDLGAMWAIEKANIAV